MTLCAVITAAAIWTWQAPVTERSIKRFTIPLPSSVQFRDLGQGALALSPDGQHLVYSATDNQSFFVRDFHTGETHVLEGTQTAADD